jgi:hypothetical protein
VIAVVATRTVTATPVGVHDQRYAAVRTLNRAATLPAEDSGIEPPPVQENQRLLTGLEAPRDGVLQASAQNYIRAVFGVLEPHVHE